MAKDISTRKSGAGAKAIAAVTLVVALLLTGVFMYYGVMGRDMDAEGLYKLLPWLPTPGENTRWRQALVPGADLGETMRSTLTLTPAEGETVTPEQLEEAVRIVSFRLAEAGWAGAQIEVADGKILAAISASADAVHALALLNAQGEVAFATPTGEKFMTGEHIARAWYSPAQEAGMFALNLEMTEEGKQLFAEKTQELVGQSISILLDGQSVADPRISQALVDGFASVPGFTEEQARNLAVMLRSGPLPLPVAEEGHEQGAALLGEGVLDRLVTALLVVVALVLVFVIIRYRVGGLVVAWVLALQLALMHFFAALMGAGYTLSTLLAVYGSFVLAAFSVLLILGGTSDDLSRGRSVQQALRDSYGNAGHTSLDVLGGLLALSVVLIIMDTQAIGNFMRILGVGLLLDLVLVHMVLRVLMTSTIHLVGEKTSLYHRRGAAKEAV